MKSINDIICTTPREILDVRGLATVFMSIAITSEVKRNAAHFLTPSASGGGWGGGAGWCVCVGGGVIEDVMFLNA